MTYAEASTAKMPSISYEDRHSAIAMHAWETWTKNGLNMDDDMREQTAKSASDAATNAFRKGMHDGQWLAATLRKLGARAFW